MNTPQIVTRQNFETDGYVAVAAEYANLKGEGHTANDAVADLLAQIKAAAGEKSEPSEIHPAPIEFTEAELVLDHVLRYFHYQHLPQKLQKVSRPFCHLASLIVREMPRNPERTVALRKLLEAKDAAVRTMVE